MLGTVNFSTTGEPGDERLVREYVFDAAARLPEQPGCDGVAFTPLARKADLGEMDLEGGVLVQVWGDDVDTVVERERDRWDTLVEEGLAESWEWSVDDGTLADYMGDRGADRYLEYQALATRLSRLVYETFDAAPDPVDEYPGEDRTAPAGVGWWRLLHLLTIQQNYRYQQELDAYVEGIRSTIHTIAEFDNRDQALRATNAIIESLEALRAELDT